MQTSDLIVAIFRGNFSGSLSLQDWSKVIRILRYQQCLARLSWRIREKCLPIDLPAYARHHFDNAELIAQKQFHQVHYEAALLQRLLQPYSQHLLFLKGAAYSLNDNATVGCGRTYSDIDVLVDKESLPMVEQELALYGFFSDDLDEYDQKYYREWSHEIPPLRHGNRGTVLDVHHNLLPPVTGRAPDNRVFFQHTQKTSAGYTVFRPAAMFLHSSVHLFLNEEIKHGFRDLTDLYLIIEQYQSPQFWQELVDLAVECNFTVELILALRYTQQILGAKIPDTVTEQLTCFEPNRFKLSYLDFIYLRMLRPSHPVLMNFAEHFAEWLLLLRGHWLKMPLHLLIKHLVRKTSRQVVTAMFGSNVLDKKKHTDP